LNQVFHITTVGNAPDAAKQALLIRVGKRHFGFAISNTETNELVQLTWYVADENGHFELDEMYSKHDEFRTHFNKVVICFDHPCSLLIPLENYSGQDLEKFLNAVYGTNGKQVIMTEKIPGWQLQNVYAIPVDVEAWLKRHFANGEYLHNYSVGIQQIGNTGGEERLQVDFRSNDFSAVVSKGGRLMLAQTVSYATPGDVLYYLVKVCQEFSFNRDGVNLVISGLVEKNSSLFRELDQYFLQIRFREPSWRIQAEGEQTYPSHFFTSLNDLALCVS
jgi:hypothetical protein